MTYIGTAGGDDIGTAGGDDIVADLLAVPFSRRTFHEKMDIVKKGRPTAEHLELNQPAKAGFVRHFQASNWSWKDTVGYHAQFDARGFTAGSASCLGPTRVHGIGKAKMILAV